MCWRVDLNKVATSARSESVLAGKPTCLVRTSSCGRQNRSAWAQITSLSVSLARLKSTRNPWAQRHKALAHLQCCKQFDLTDLLTSTFPCRKVSNSNGHIGNRDTRIRNIFPISSSKDSWQRARSRTSGRPSLRMT